MQEKNLFKLFKESLKNKNSWVPNLLTTSRLFGTIIIPLLFFSGNYIGTAIATAAFSATDFFDGRIARKTGGYSEFGKVLDPIVDKIFAIGLSLVILPLAPILVVNLIPEIAIAIINSKSYKNKGKPKSSYLGKLKTFALFPTIGLCYISAACNLEILNIITVIAALGTLGLQSVATYDYYQKAKKEKNEEHVVDKENKENKEKSENLIVEKQQEKNYTKEMTTGELIEALKQEKNNLIGVHQENAKVKQIKKQGSKFN